MGGTEAFFAERARVAAVAESVAKVGDLEAVRAVVTCEETAKAETRLVRATAVEAMD